MFALKQIVRLLTCFLICSTSEDLKEIKAKPGDNVVLQCLGTRDATIELLEWSRPDLKQGYVFYFRDSLVYEDFQYELFHGRVKLKDPEMKDGDASVILKNVNDSDTGTYRCRIIMGHTRRMQTDALEFNSMISLKVDDSGNDKEEGGKSGHVGLIVGLLIALILVIVGGFVIYGKCSKNWTRNMM